MHFTKNCQRKNLLLWENRSKLTHVFGNGFALQRLKNLGSIIQSSFDINRVKNGFDDEIDNEMPLISFIHSEKLKVK